MPEVYEPKKRRGNAGKTGFRRTPRAKQPFWPGMDLNDNLIRPPSSRKKNASLEPAIDESPSKVHRKSDPTEDDPILSFDNDPPSHDTGKAIGLMTGDLSSSASAEEDATFSQQTTSPPTSPSGKKRPRRFRDVELLLEAANSSQESHNKITEIVPTRGTRSGRQFRSPQRPTKKSQQKQQGIEVNDSAAALPKQGGAIGDGHEEKSPEVFHKKSTEALDELEFGRGLVEDEVEEQGRHDKKEKERLEAQQENMAVEKHVSFQKVAEKSPSTSPSSRTSSPMGFRPRRKRKKATSMVEQNVDAKSQFKDLSEDASLTPEKPQDQSDVSCDNDLQHHENEQQRSLSGRKPVQIREGTGTTDTLTPSAPFDSHVFTELAQNIVGNQLPVIGRAMEEIWTSLLKVLPQASQGGASPTLPGTNTPVDAIRAQGENFLASMRELCVQQEASVRRLEELRVSMEEYARQKGQKADNEVSKLSAQLKESRGSNTTLEKELAETKAANHRLNIQLQENVTILDRVKLSHEQVMKVKDTTIASQALELQRLRDEVANLRGRNEVKQEENRKERAPVDIGATVDAVEREQPAESQSELVENVGNVEEDLTAKRSHPIVLLRKATKKPAPPLKGTAKQRGQGWHSIAGGNAKNSGDGKGASQVNSVKIPVPLNPPRFLVRIKTETAPSTKPATNNSEHKQRHHGPITIDSP